MAKNWAICIGINQYDYLTPLQYAREDARLMQEFLKQDAGFQKVILFVTGAPDDSRKPNRANLRRVIRQLVSDAKMQPGDNFWFFFSGHGMRHNGQDYLMPVDGDCEDIEETALPIHFVTDALRQCGADNVVLLLDACRNQGKKGGEGIGRETSEKARETGTISIFSCSPNQYSYEIEALQQGAFTRALLDGLGIQGQCATVERLNQYLSHRVPELLSLHRSDKIVQTPYSIAEPINRSHLILLPKYATQADIAVLKNDAYQAEIKKDWQLARELWVRVNAASLGTDMDAIDAFPRVFLHLSGVREEGKETLTPSPTKSKGNSASEAPEVADQFASLQTFSFETVTVNRKGEIIQRQTRQARYLREDCNGVPLDLIAIPGGMFWMGTEEAEIERLCKEDNVDFYRCEGPRHRVTVQSFFLGKYPVTQAQWEALMGNNPSGFKGANRPVETVSWFDAMEFCKKLSQRTGKSYRLPSEAEWEYACRAGTTTPFSCGETITTDLANYDGDYTYADEPKGQSREQTTDVGSFPPNPFGLYDMHGNVWEWCLDDWHGSHENAPTDGKPWLNNNISQQDASKVTANAKSRVSDDSTPNQTNDNNFQLKVLRGGSWYVNPLVCRSAIRLNDNDPVDRLINVGFRVVYVAPRTL